MGLNWSLTEDMLDVALLRKDVNIVKCKIKWRWSWVHNQPPLCLIIRWHCKDKLMIGSICSSAFDHCIVRVADSNLTFPSNICGSHGACVSRRTGFLCTCLPGYSGRLCRHGKYVISALLYFTGDTREICYLFRMNNDASPIESRDASWTRVFFSTLNRFQFIDSARELTALQKRENLNLLADVYWSHLQKKQSEIVVIF